MTMTHKEFFWWLKGYIQGETYLENADIEEIKDQMEKVQEYVQPLVNRPTWVGSGTITIPCDTGMTGSNVNTTLTVPVTSPQLLKD
jgi:hypothetical protein